LLAKCDLGLVRNNLPLEKVIVLGMRLTTRLLNRAVSRCVACLFALVTIVEADAAVTRGPYLQQGTPTGVVVRWRSDVATDSSVRYGVSPVALNNTSSVPALVTNHIVAITNLQPDTKYFYQFGTSAGWYATDTNHYFITSPVHGTIKPTRIWALGDSGTQDQDQYDCRDAYITFNGSRPTDVWLMLGDNAYNSGTDTEYQGAVYEAYPMFLRNTVLWPTIGNHDSPSLNSAYLPMFTLPENGEAGGVPSGTENYYSFDYANIHFVCLDSSSSDRDVGSPMLNWLQTDLAATTQEWIIAFWHHPPYTKGSHNSDVEGNLIEVRQNIIPILENYGVDLVLCGHSHGYERSYLLDGHYGHSSTLTAEMKKDGGSGRENGTGAYRKPGGNAPHEGAVYIVAGSSGHATGGTYNHPAMFVSLNLVGSAVIDVISNRLDMYFLTTDAQATDWFTLIKEPAATAPPDAPTALAATAVSSTRINLVWSDDSTNEQGFRIERSLDNTNFSEFAVVGAAVTNRADTNRTPLTTYYYRVRAYNAAGTSAYSPVAQATTPVALPSADTNAPAAITNLVVLGMTSNSVTLAWAAPGDDGTNGTATAYHMRFRTNAFTASNWTTSSNAVGEPDPLPAGATQTMTVFGLSANRTYHFALRAVDETNNMGALSNPAFTQTPAPGPAGITNIFVVASNSVWKYLDNGGPQGTAWRGRTFPDGTWASGPAQLGYNSEQSTVISYGPNSSSKYITTYFRRHFEVGDPAVYDALNFAVQRDDGVVVYLNGFEMFRNNMPAGTVNYQTVASTNASGNGRTMFYRYGPFAAATNLVAGDNVIAAEVHLRSASTSTSMSFNLEMTATLARPQVKLVRAAGDVTLQWPSSPGKRYRVEYAPIVPSTNWITLGDDITASGFVTGVSDPDVIETRFYRVLVVQ
jgi:acid phosphatase type 7